MLVHAHQAEEWVVVLGDGAAWLVAELLVHLQVVEVAAVGHGEEVGLLQDIESSGGAWWHGQGTHSY
jgi:hypothetical protein